MKYHGAPAAYGPHNPDHEGAAAGTVKDPVCGMVVDPAKTAHHTDHAGHAYHFGSAGYPTKFIAEPGKYLQARAPLRAEAAAPGAIYTCLMHRQIRQPDPGSCPICGMALEPETPSAEAGPIRTTDMAGCLAAVATPDGALLLDVREDAEFAAGHVPEAVNIPRELLEFRVWPRLGYQARVDMNRRIDVQCQTGGRAAFAARQLQDIGFTNVVAVIMNFDEWRRQGHPVL
jgi:rhodanese-related sulfurtransferase/YHS domain-containing protein